jgi:hypothetical protein
MPAEHCGIGYCASDDRSPPDAAMLILFIVAKYIEKPVDT